MQLPDFAAGQAALLHQLVNGVCSLIVSAPLVQDLVTQRLPIQEFTNCSELSNCSLTTFCVLKPESMQQRIE